MITSPESRGDLAAALMRSQVIFSAALLAIEFRLALHACGFFRLNVSAEKLTQGLAQLQFNLAQMAPTAA